MDELQETGLPIVASVYDSFETDEALEREGVDFYFGQGAGTWTLAYIGDQAFQAAFADRMKPLSHAQSQGLLDPKIINDILCELYGKHIVRGFRDVIGRDGKEVVFSTEVTIKMFKELRHLFRLVRDSSQNFANYRKVYAEETAKK